MPKALAVDWKTAKVLYLQGIPQTTIANKLGIGLPALKTRISRGGWILEKRNAMKVVPLTNKDLPSRARAVKECLGEIHERTARRLAAFSIETMTLKPLRTYQEIVSNLQRSAWGTFGLEAGDQKTVVHVGTLNLMGESLFTPISQAGVIEAEVHSENVNVVKGASAPDVGQPEVANPVVEPAQLEPIHNEGDRPITGENDHDSVEVKP